MHYKHRLAVTCLPALWLALLLLMQNNLPAVEIIAHRGASADAPENTLRAMELAWKQQADAIELDLWLSKDGKLVVFHDSTTKRFDGTTRRVPELAWDEMQQLDVGSWKSPEFKGERIPTLESILATIPAGRRAVLEIKCGPEILPELKRVLENAARPAKELAIISFNFETIRQSKRLLPQVEHYFLHDYKKQPPTDTYPELGHLIKRCQKEQIDGLNLNFNWPITPNFVTQVKSAGLKLFVWTVNDPAVARRLVDAGVDGITTDKPEWLRAQLSQVPSDQEQP